MSDIGNFDIFIPQNTLIWLSWRPIIGGYSQSQNRPMRRERKPFLKIVKFPSVWFSISITFAKKPPMCYDGFENLTRMQGMNQLACSVLHHVTKDYVRSVYFGVWYWCWYCEKILLYFRLKTAETVSSVFYVGQAKTDLQKPDENQNRFRKP